MAVTVVAEILQNLGAVSRARLVQAFDGVLSVDTITSCLTALRAAGLVTEGADDVIVWCGDSECREASDLVLGQGRR